jgi:ketosteroid isomerase-like protein
MPIRTLFVVLVATACASAPRASDTPPDGAAAEAAIQAQLSSMLTAWNADNLDAHIAPYADNATWTSATGLLRGKSVIRETLVKGFQRGTDLAGRLEFDPPVFTRLGADYMMTNGGFHLDSLPSGRPINGQSTLIWHRNGARWEIIHDHSS